VTVALPSDAAQAIALHIEALRRIPSLAGATVVVVPECNLPYIAESIFETLRTVRPLRNIDLFYERVSASGSHQASGVGDFNRAGLLTRHKGEMAERIRRMLAMRRILVHDEFVTYTTPNPAAEQRMRDQFNGDLAAMRDAIAPHCTDISRVFVEAARLRMRQTLIEQFTAFKLYETHGKRGADGEARVYRSYSGKDGGKKRDDVFSAFGIGITALAMRDLKILK
jgi:hypothetical protein